MPVNPDTFKKVLGSFATGVTIVTFRDEMTYHGLTVNAFSSVSLDPPLVLVCVKKDSTSHAMMSRTDGFVVNILSDLQQDLAWKFANPRLSSQERYENIAFATNTRGIPVFADNLASLECKITEGLQGGDHTIFLGQVENATYSEDRKPLVYYRSEFHDL